MGNVEFSEIGEIISNIRENKKGLTQEGLAGEIHLDQTTISRIETGNYPLDSLNGESILMDIGKALDSTFIIYYVLGRIVARFLNKALGGIFNEQIFKKLFRKVN